MLSVLAMAYLAQERLVLELSLDLALLFPHGSFVKEFIGFFLQRLDVVLVEHLCAVQLLDELFVDPCFAWSPFGAKLYVDEVEYTGFHSVAVGLCLFLQFWLVISVV